MTKLCQFKGVVPRWQVAHFGPKISYFGHIFEISTLFYNYIDIGTNRINSQSDSNWLFYPQ